MKNPAKHKIFNDPIYGFISIPDKLAFRLLEHPYFQRLRRIKQLGLTNLVYPGALHTRFHHAMGATHLMSEALEVLRMKGHEITPEEAQGALVAILLHDVGHGPFSHSLEHSIVSGVSHEHISELFMKRFNEELDGRLGLAIKIFRGEYRKKFLHQLVSSQLDVDRMDYLLRDSFYTGVSEGVISSDRIIKMLNVHRNELVVESKGIYSVEKFIIARRLMYWQVYLHKTVLSAENLLVNILRRAKEIARKGTDMFCTPALRRFLYNDFTLKDFQKNAQLLDVFAELDDYDIMASVKVWTRHPDAVLSRLSNMLVSRQLYKIELQSRSFDTETVSRYAQRAVKKLKIKEQDAHYFVFTGVVANDTYSTDKIRINILFRDGAVADITEASDQLNIDVLARTVKKSFLCYPRELAG